MMKAFFSTLLIFCFIVGVAQQRPFINNIDKKTAAVGETITISGSGFDANPANLKVFFGAGEGTIISSTTTQIKVTVPGNATYDAVTVINTSNGLSGVSSELFTISYGGGSFSTTGFDAFDEFNTGSLFSYELCLCDFDLDGLSDLGITHRSSQEVRFFQNQSTVNTTSFAEMGSITVADNNFRSTGIDCGDLNMDGLPDVVFASNIGNNPIQIYFYENAGGISFTQRLSVPLPLNGTEVRTPRKLKLADIDGDGRKDLVIGSESGNSIFVYLNNYSGGNLSFNTTPIRIAVTGLADAGTIDVKDMNNDNLPDIAVIAFDEANQPLAFLRNTSSPGSVSFSQTTINSLEQRNYTYIGDLNNDSYPEIITSNAFGNRISVFRNTTSTQGGVISFNSTPLSLLNIQSAWGINMGDMNGDGLPDLIVSSGLQGVRVFINSTDGNSISFNNPSILLSTSGTEIVRNLKTGDLNGDARPDVIFSYNSTSGAPGKIGTFMNRNCYEPVISPPDLTFCLNDQFTLFATKTLAATYNWSISSGTGTITPNGDNADVTITAGTSATITVEIVPSNNGNGSCTNTTNQVFTITNGTPTPTPTITPSAANDVCTGETNFTLSAAAGLDNYYWTLPDGSSGPNQNVLTIPTLTSAEAGVYTLRTQTGAGCVSDETTYEVIVNEPPFININNQDQDNFCDGSTITLEVPNYPGFTYSWEKDGSPIAGTTNTLDVTASGTYNAIISNTCDNRSPDYTVTAVPAPVSSFNTSYAAASTTEICLDVPLDFNATSTGTGSFALTYDWDYGDATNGSGVSSSHAYSAAQQYAATLTTSYTDITGCSNQAMSTITITDQVPGDIPITVVGGSTEKCPSDTLLVQLPANYISYDWSTGDTDFEAEAFTGSGETQVTLTADVETNIGCMVTVQQTITNFPNSGIDVVAAEATITNDTLQVPEGMQMVTLTASNAVGNYSWAVNDAPSDVTTSTLEVRPTQRTTVVSVTGTDPNGCTETTTTTVLLPSILARKTFSPNADGQGFDCWEILNTSALEGCTVYVFDNRGRHILEANSPFIDNCVWDGMAQGQQAPEGIYYFVLKCDVEENNLNGTITLAR